MTDTSATNLMEKITGDEPIELLRAKVFAQCGYELTGLWGYTRAQELAYAKWWAAKYKIDEQDTIEYFLWSFDRYAMPITPLLRRHERKVLTGRAKGSFFKPPRRLPE